MRFSLAGLLCGMTLLAIGFSGLASGQRSGIFQTGRELDLAIVGRGFFELTEVETGNQYFTRRGRFHLNVANVLVWTDGQRECYLEPNIVVPSSVTRVVIESDGHVFVEEGQRELTCIGGIHLATFGPDSLELPRDPIGFQRDAAPGPPLIHAPGISGIGLLQQGWIEEQEGWMQRFMQPPLLLTIAGLAVLSVPGWLAYEVARLRDHLGQLSRAEEQCAPWRSSGTEL